MKAFADLYMRLDATTSSNAKLGAMQDYFRAAAPADAGWAVYFLAGGRPRQLVATKTLRQLAIAAGSVPEWLFEESYQSVGDLAETIALLLPMSSHVSEAGLASWVEERLLPLRGIDPPIVIERLRPWLNELDRASQLVCIKLITGSFRVGVSKLLVTRALAGVAGIDAKRIAQRLVGYTDLSARPTASDFQRLIAQSADHAPGANGGDPGHPYPFFLAHPLQIPVEEFAAQIGSPADFQIEWKWDGIRAQIVKRNGQLWIWSRGEELVTDRFPELHPLARSLPDGTVIDGELVVWKDDRVQPFALLQQRIGRKALGAALLEKVPVAMIAYDLLQSDGIDLRGEPQDARRQKLERLIAQCTDIALRLSPLIEAGDWNEVSRHQAGARTLGVEGVMLKGRDARYGVGRTKDTGVWWKWKIDPYTVDAVLLYAQRGHGRRASLYSDFTFAVWDRPPGAVDAGDSARELVPFAKAYSGLTDAEMRRVDAIVRRTTVEKFGPVRSVTPTLVFELGFEGIARSSRHKSGIAVRFPRMLRWREDKPIAEADTLQTLRGWVDDASRS